jgi:DNA-binding SARP family transcriptional activator
MSRCWSLLRGRSRRAEIARSVEAAVDPLAEAQCLFTVVDAMQASTAVISTAETARELYALEAEHRSLAEQLERLAYHHRRIAICQGRAAVQIMAGGSPPDEFEVISPSPVAATAITEPVSELGDRSEVSDASNLTVRVLGPMQVVAGGFVVGGFRSYQIRTLFQYLVLNRRPTHREMLMELLWPGHTFGSARNNLNVCIYGLRRALLNGGPPRELIVYRDGCYLLNPDVEWNIDRDRFRYLAAEARRHDVRGELAVSQGAAEQAVALYRGPLFEGDPAADWFLIERRSLRDLYIQTLEALVALYLDGRDDVNRASQAAERILQEDSSRESGHRLLMRCHSRRNERDLVVRQYRICRDTLAELGVAPSAETNRVYEECTGIDQPGLNPAG